MQRIKDIFKKIWAWVKAHKLLSIIGVIIVVIILVSILKGAKQAEGQYVVARQTVTQAVTLSGTVSAVDSSDLGFADSGRIDAVYVHEGDTVTRGQLLARLESADLYAELAKAEATERSSVVDVKRAQAYLDAVTREQDTLVANAKRKLLSADLEAIPDQNDDSSSAPTVSGTYTGDIEGSYVIDGYASGGSAGASFKVSGLENGFATAIVYDVPVALGTHGLYLTFPSGSSYSSGTWTIQIPNKMSSSYVTNKNAYDEAVRTHDRVIEDARQALLALTSQQSGGASSVAHAEVLAVQAQIARRSIRAPFAGTVGTINADLGESVTANDIIVHLVGAGAYQVELSIPELDIGVFASGQKVNALFDAFPDNPYTATVTRISSSETETDGVPVYKVFAVLDTPDARIRSGMSARVTLETQSHENVLAVLTSYVQFGKGSPRVRVLEGKKTIVEKEVTTGLRGTNGLIEITEGLNEHDVVVPFPAISYGAK